MNAPLRRVVPPLLTFIKDWPRRAQPPIPPVRPDRILPTPRAVLSREVDPCVPSARMSSTSCRVRRLSTRPTAAIVRAKGKHFCIVKRFMGTEGSPSLGRTDHPPAKVSFPARSARVVAGSFSTVEPSVTRNMAESEAGSLSVTRGMVFIKNAVAAHRPAMVIPLGLIKSKYAPVEVSLKCASCAFAITIARPLTNPSITGCGTSLMNLPARAFPTRICSTPARSTVGPRNSTPCSRTSSAMTTAQAPDAPVMTPPLPPPSATAPPMTTVVQRPQRGETPATNANDTASGIMARAQVMPAMPLAAAAEA
mmetsp:Transcript_2173/g.4661  ORF Transcript_2173/g.4661 Transcript_2173/m.4661 type:complete len:309 (+) Transcript_2173:655-1581(+)